ncbi:hypothetical protein [Thiosulfativibrio zosterae]|uniref:Uncharacterized protein n=1 Tax=Thiosulfativibrio zosterae TaxID=2675053 RepID=A0A6F8PR90_9GAMM|nr:hypothetical protein [Thiosulfativibrio zosterae]BBP44547.1 hypothetical protein THMIRHAT_22930 [Thiosulfativibrio zosterae]
MTQQSDHKATEHNPKKVSAIKSPTSGCLMILDDLPEQPIDIQNDLECNASKAKVNRNSKTN